MLENNPAGLERAELERVVGISITYLSGSSTTQRIYRHREAPPRQIAERRRGDRATDLRLTASTADGRVTALRTAGARRRRSKKSADATDNKKGGGRGKCYVCGSEEHFAHKHCGFCRSLEHRTRDYEEQGAEKGVVLAKLNVPANFEVGLLAATTGAARADSKEEWDSDSGVSFNMFHTQAGMTTYKKALAGATVEVADGTIFPVDGFRIVEVGLDQPGTTIKPVKMVSVGYVPGLLRRHGRRHRIARKRHGRRNRTARKKRIPTRRHGRRHRIQRRGYSKHCRIPRRRHGRCHWIPGRRHGNCHRIARKRR